ncbi:MAG TPA: glycogen debranching enzyme GlgX [Planctomycetaceae bacterium]|nr:glycogen debranching enzyme GlgX [Planctomycetaceae bacterium]
MFDSPSTMRFNYPLPFGATLHDNGVHFSLVSRSARSMRLLLYDKVSDLEPSQVIEFNREKNRWGDVWSMFIKGINARQLYHFQVGEADGPRLIDPYAKALAGSFQSNKDGILRPPKCVVIDDADFDWRDDPHLKHDLSKSVIYEMHVGGFTKSKSSQVKEAGTYLGAIKKIPYLKELGVTAVELMPVHEFLVGSIDGTTGGRTNFWGYDTMAFFAPHRGYAYGKEPGAQVREFKEMVRAFHAAGIEVILDVVFNHTCEGNERGPTLSFRGLDNDVYYMLHNGKEYKNYSGCGNTVNGNHPIVRELIFNSLRYWVHNYHIDGFRFDLASILSRDQNGNLLANPPLVEQIAEDPLLADTKIIAEAWDAAGAYQVGSFFSSHGPNSMGWAEWNGKYRDDIRRFWRGDQFFTGALATRMAGSSDLYQHSGRQPFCSINFITSHDGFTLNDLVSYNSKHNEDNGEHNRDGDNNSMSCNYGVEGPTSIKEIEATRARQIRNMMATLLLSQGVPMIVAGDEFRKTQRGNNNAYCQDSTISWLDWRLEEKHRAFVRFVRTLIKFRKEESTVRQSRFLTGQPRRPGALPDIGWYGPLGGAVPWNNGLERSLTCLLAAVQPSDGEASRFHILIMAHGGWEPRDFYFPAICQGFKWRLFVDTQAAPPNDIYPQYDGPPADLKAAVRFMDHSLKVYIADASDPVRSDVDRHVQGVSKAAPTSGNRKSRG